MAEKWVRDAIAAQEEHIKRSTSCRGVIGTAHHWRKYGNPRTGKAYEACVVCDVTRTGEDYAARLAKGKPRRPLRDSTAAEYENEGARPRSRHALPGVVSREDRQD
jgi:hypothetical protein